MSGTRRKPGVKGHWNLPRGGRETCPVAVTRELPGDGHGICPGADHHRPGAQLKGLTPCPARACDRRTLSPVVWQMWAWCSSRSTVAVASVLGMSSSNAAGWRLEEMAAQQHPEVFQGEPRHPQTRFGGLLTQSLEQERPGCARLVGSVPGSRTPPPSRRPRFCRWGNLPRRGGWPARSVPARRLRRRTGHAAPPPVPTAAPSRWPRPPGRDRGYGAGATGAAVLEHPQATAVQSEHPGQEQYSTRQWWCS